MAEEFNIEIGLRVRKLREGYRYTREELAENADISVAFLGKIESGEKGISAKTLAKLSGALRVSSDFILFGEDLDYTYIEQAIARFSPEEQEFLCTLFGDAIRILNARK